MKNVTIFISLVPGTHDLYLTDSEGHSGGAEEFISDVNRGDIVTWKLADNSGIDDLTGIVAKDGVFNIFVSGEPYKRPNGTWHGIVKSDASGVEAYNIDFKISQNVFSVDPKLQVKT